MTCLLPVWCSLRGTLIRSFGWQFFTLIALVLSGCSGQSPSTLPIAATENPTAPVGDDRIRFVSAVDWLEFAVRQPLQEDGWIALPPRHSADLYQSRQAPEALGLFGPDRCTACHEEIVASFQQTAHARTCRLPSRDAILGALDPPHNQLTTAVDGFYFAMAERDGQFYQDVFVPEDSEHPRISVPIALVFGSGNHGQSYVHREGSQLCQMPVSYYSEFDRWTNSPGTYRDGTADFARPVTTRCLDCHTTWVGHQPETLNQYDASTWILGVTCVRCHGPAHDHIQFHELQAEDTEGQFIVNPAKLGRDRLMEVCAQCHSGGGELRRPAFSYIPGEPLLEYLDIDLTASSEQNDDPHSANQLGRLSRSACFQGSEELSCITCHDPHRHDRGNTPLFSNRCRQCHDTEDCGVSPRLGSLIHDRCIECHMPAGRDPEVSAASGSRTVSPLLRDHLIAVWPEVSDQVEQKLISSASGTGPVPRDKQ